MTVQTVTLTMPEALYQRAKQTAEVLKQPLEDVLVDTLAFTLPVLDDVPAEMVEELAAMTHLSDEALQGLANNIMPQERQTLLHHLLDEQGRAELNEVDKNELASLMAEYGRYMLRRAKAMALLIARGRPVPTLATLTSKQ